MFVLEQGKPSFHIIKFYGVIIVYSVLNNAFSCTLHSLSIYLKKGNVYNFYLLLHNIPFWYLNLNQIEK